jgi:hypothetical protein
LPVSYKTVTEVPPSYYEKVSDYMYWLFFDQEQQRFSGLSKEMTPNGNRRRV